MTVFQVGDRVVLDRYAPYPGEMGTIRVSPGKMFNGWAVELDNGLVIGAADHWIKRADRG